jgi:putative salt-induced outer membrane protein YdiY
LPKWVDHRERAAFVNRLCVIACLFVILGAHSARADEVRLLNGDRISGRVMSLSNGLLVFQTPHGDLRVPWLTVAAVTVVEPIFVTIGARPAAAATISPDGNSGRVELRPGGFVLMTEIVGLSRPAPPPVAVNGRLNAGIIASGGNTDTSALRFSGELVARSLSNRLTGSATLNRAREADVATARNWSTSVRYDRFISQRFFVNGNTILSSDRLRDLTFRTAVGTGLGYQVLDRRRLKITTDAGVGYVKEVSAVGVDDRYIAAQESARVDVFVDASRFQLFHRHDGYFGLAGNDNRFVKTQNGVRVSIVRGIIATAQLDVDYDPTPVAGRQSIDRTFALNFGYQF